MTSKKKNEQIKNLIERLLNMITKEPIVFDGLSMGRSSLILLYFYYSRYADKEEFSNKGYFLIEEVFSHISVSSDESLKTADFFNGFTGFMSVLSNLKQNGLLEVSYEDFNDIDTMICDWGSSQFRQGNIDFFYGGTGCLHYFISRNQIQADSCFIDELIKNLLPLFTTSGKTFGIINDYYNKADDRHHKEINFSLAHGMASVVLCLTRLWKNGYRTYGVHTHAIGAIEYLLDITDMAPVPAPHCFSAAINLDTNKTHCQSRLGWCYSDLNILQLLLEAGETFERKDWIDRAVSASPVVAGRISKKETLVEDPYLCHGTAGLLQYYLKLKERKNLPEFSKAASHWSTETISWFDKTPDDYFSTPAYLEKGHIHSLFYGPAGVALCLLSALDKESSNWSSIIML